MTRKSRIVAILGGVGLLAFGGLWAVVPKLLRDAPQFVYSPSVVDDAAVEVLATPGWTVDRFEVEPGVTLVGLVRAPAAADAPWLLFFGGNGAELLAGTKRLAEGVRGAEDWGVAFWAYRGFDASTGAPSMDALAADAAALAGRLQDRWSVSPDRLHVVGFSLGSWFAAQLSGALAGRGTPPASLSLLAPFTAIDVNVNAWYRHWRRPDAYRMPPLRTLETAPTLIVHGEDDRILPVENARSVADGLGDGTVLVTLPGEGHVSLLDASAAHEAVRRHIAATLRP